jgi:hypothetical protein
VGFRFILLIGIVICSLAQAADPVCQFIPRPMFDFLLAQQPDAVIGLATCYKKFPATNAFIVARLPNHDDDSIQGLLANLADVEVFGGGKTYVIKQQPEDGSEHKVLQTETSDPVNPMWHFTFTAMDSDGSTLVYFHTAHKRETEKILSTLRYVRRQLASVDFVKQIHAPLQPAHETPPGRKR